MAEQERELKRLESEIQEKRQMLDRQKQALSLLQPLIASVLNEPKVLTVELETVRHKPIGTSFVSGFRVKQHYDT
jgi:hypothetical protein